MASIVSPHFQELENLKAHISLNLGKNKYIYYFAYSWQYFYLLTVQQAAQTANFDITLTAFK